LKRRGQSTRKNFDCEVAATPKKRAPEKTKLGGGEVKEKRKKTREGGRKTTPTKKEEVKFKTLGTRRTYEKGGERGNVTSELNVGGKGRNWKPICKQVL